MEKILVKDIDKINLDGKVIVFPTDTVYGLGCRIDDKLAIKKIYEIKNRDYSKPLAVLAPNKNIDAYVVKISAKAKILMDKYWPGALTIVFEKSDKIDDMVTSNLKSVGIRVPNSDIALTVLKRFGMMCTTSINISGSEPLNNIEDIEKYFKDKIDYLVIDKCSLSKISSTVVDARGDDLKILRNGDIKIES